MKHRYKQTKLFNYLLLFIFFLQPSAAHSQQQLPAALADTGILAFRYIENSRSWKSIKSDYELALMRALRSELEAVDKAGMLRAEETLLNARIEFREQLESFMLDLLNTAYNTDSAVLNEQLASLRLLIAEETLRQNRTRFSSGQIPEHEVTESEAALRSAELALETARWNLDDATADFLYLTGSLWDSSLLPLPGEQSYHITDPETWLADDAVIRRAEVRLQLQNLAFEQLPSNTPPYNLRLALKEKEQAERALERAESASRRRYEQLRRQLLHEKENIRLRSEEVMIHRDLVQNAGTAFEQGLISRAALEQARIQLVQAEQRKKQSTRAYLAALVSALVYTENTADWPGRTEQ